MPSVDAGLGIRVEHDTTSLLGTAYRGGVVSISSMFAHDRIVIPTGLLDEFIDALTRMRDILQEANMSVATGAAELVMRLIAGEVWRPGNPETAVALHEFTEQYADPRATLEGLLTITLANYAQLLINHYGSAQAVQVRLDEAGLAMRLEAALLGLDMEDDTDE